MTDQLNRRSRPRTRRRPCLALLGLAVASGEAAAGLAESEVQALKALPYP